MKTPWWDISSKYIILPLLIKTEQKYMFPIVLLYIIYKVYILLLSDTHCLEYSDINRFYQFSCVLRQASFVQSLSIVWCLIITFGNCHLLLTFVESYWFKQKSRHQHVKTVSPSFYNNESFLFRLLFWFFNSLKQNLWTL